MKPYSKTPFMNDYTKTSIRPAAAPFHGYGSMEWPDMSQYHGNL